MGRLHDGIQFASTLSRRRIVNGWKNYQSFQAAQRKGNTHHPALPFSISVEPTTSCNLRCPECPSGLRSFSRPTGMMQLETFRKLIDELHLDLSYLILYFQGEPYLNPDFFDTIAYASSKNVYTATSTNAHYLDEDNAIRTVTSGLKRIIVSVDGTDQETYQTYRIGGQLDKVKNGIQTLVKAKKSLNVKSPHIILQFIVFQHNQHQMKEARQLAKDLGVDELEFKTAQVYDFEKGSSLIPDDSTYSRYQQNGNGNYHIKSDLRNKCWKMWHSCVMTWDGNIVPCCFDKDAKYTMGNISETPFKEIWNGDRYRDFRARLFEDRNSIDICKNCTEGLKV